MDLSYYDYIAPTQPYRPHAHNHHFVALSTDPFSRTEPGHPDPSASMNLNPTFFGGAYDTFTFNGLPTPQHAGSPEQQLAQTPPMPIGSLDSGLGGEPDEGAVSRTRDSSEEKDTSITPAQSRRKAQNRAAQRAFRERKERHIRELENKLTALETSKHSLQSDNERLKFALQRARTENEILRATSAHAPASSAQAQHNDHHASASYPSPGAHLPLEEGGAISPNYNVQSLPNGSVINSAAQDSASHNSNNSSNSNDTANTLEPRSRQIAAAQAWDVIQAHPLVQQGFVSVAEVSERLKGAATCDGHGPVFEETTIWRVIEESRHLGSDELI